MTDNFNYVVRDREAGNIISYHETYEEAEKSLELYERIDQADGTYTPDFYEIYPSGLLLDD